LPRANVGATAEDLLTYAVLGSVYSCLVLGIAKPRVALLNIGTEAQKGNEVTREAYELLQAAALNFVGNVLLKGVAGFLLQLTQGIRGELKSSTRARHGGSLAKPAHHRALRIMDYIEYGGAPLFGLNGACIKCHGASSGVTVANGIRVAAQFAATDVLGAMATALAAQPRTEAIATRG